MLRALKHLLVYDFENKERKGSKNDGGYVIGKLDTTYDCYISAGVCDEESFSRDFIKDYNMKKENCFAFDGTIKDYPYEYTTEINFIKKNISSKNGYKTTNIYDIIDKYNNIFLKMDIEGSEFEWIEDISEERLNKIGQIVIEIHGILFSDWGYNLDKKIKCLEKLAKTHYIIHAHGNNNAKCLFNLPTVVELTYVNKSFFKDTPKLNTSSLPNKELDYPNNKDIPEIDLNFIPFVNKET